jgi:Undecaprenyl-phosphate glucose phosphotransferase
MSFDIHPGSITTQRKSAQHSPAKRAQARAAARPFVWHGGGHAKPINTVRPANTAGLPPVSLPIVSGLLRAWDVVSVLGAGLAAYLLAAPDLPMAQSYYVALAFFGALAAGNALHLAGAYRLDGGNRGQFAWSNLLIAWAGSSVAMALAVVATGAALEQNWTWLALWFILGLFLPLLARGILAIRMDYWHKAGRLRRRVAVLGAGPGGQMLLRRLGGLRSDRDVAIIGLYDDRSGPPPAGWRGHSVRGNCGDLLEDIRQGLVDMVVVAAEADDPGVDAMLAKLRCVAVDIYLCSPSHHMPRLGGVEMIGNVPLVVVERRPLRDWSGVVKAVEDRVFAALILLLIAPVLALIALAIKLDSPGPVIFRQKRYGQNNQLIEVFKFRSMYAHATDPNATKLATRNDPRVTRVGAFLRRTSLDELPQFVNVLRGEMSVVGPRPHALLCTAGGMLYQEAVRNYDWRHRIKPGITGWAQINGWRGETVTVEQIQKRVEHDIYYIENWSLLLDVKIIVRTIFGGFTGSKAY